MCQKTDLALGTEILCIYLTLRTDDLPFSELLEWEVTSRAVIKPSKAEWNLLTSRDLVHAANITTQPQPQLKEDMNCLLKAYQLHLMCVQHDATQYVSFCL